MLFAVHGLFALHMAHWLETGSTMSPLEPSEAMEFSKRSVINAGFIFFGLTILSTLFLGRWFCGWACHLVALQDLSSWLLSRVGIKPKPLSSRLLAWVPAVAALYMFLWPLVYRVGSGAEVAPARLALTKSEFWETFPPLPVALLTFFVCGGLIVYFLGSKGFCTYACPYGAIFGAVDRLAPGRIRVNDACEGCAHCTATCTSNVRVHEEVREHGMVVDPGCMKCMDCVSVCPMNALSFGFGKPAPGTRSARKAVYTWKEEGLLAVLFLVGLAVYRGLYGRVPFLLALGLSAILAYLLFLLIRLFLRGNLSLGKKVLKRGGRLTGAGRVFVASMALVLLFTVHSAMVRYHDVQSARVFESTFELQERALARSASAEGADLERARRGKAYAEFVERYGLVPMQQIDLRLAWFALVEGDDAGFEERIESFLERSPDNAAMHEDLARFYQGRGRLDEARAAYRRALELHPSSTLYDRLAQLLWAARASGEAIEVYEEAVAALPNSPDLHFNLAIAYELTGQGDEALAAFLEVLRLDPERVAAHENLGRGHLAKREFEPAIPHLRRALELAPTNLDTLELLIIALLETGAMEEASGEVARMRDQGALPLEAAARYEELIQEYGRERR